MMVVHPRLRGAVWVTNHIHPRRTSCESTYDPLYWIRDSHLSFRRSALPTRRSQSEPYVLVIVWLAGASSYGALLAFTLTDGVGRLVNVFSPFRDGRPVPDGVAGNRSGLHASS